MTLIVGASTVDPTVPLLVCTDANPTEAASSLPAVLLIVLLALVPKAVPEMAFDATDNNEPAVAAVTPIVIVASLLTDAVVLLAFVCSDSKARSA